MFNGSKVIFVVVIFTHKKVQECSGGMSGRRRLHGDEDKCQKPVKKYFVQT